MSRDVEFIAHSVTWSMGGFVLDAVPAEGLPEQVFAGEKTFEQFAVAALDSDGEFLKRMWAAGWNWCGVSMHLDHKSRSDEPSDFWVEYRLRHLKTGELRTIRRSARWQETHQVKQHADGQCEVLPAGYQEPEAPACVH